MKSQSGPEIIRAYKVIHANLTARGFNSKLVNLYNEASDILNHFVTSNDVTFQFTPDGTHCCNSAEGEIHT